MKKGPIRRALFSMANSFEAHVVRHYVPHRYVTFRQFAASFQSAAEIVLLVFAPVLVGRLAFIALPPMYAPRFPFSTRYRCWPRTRWP
jgi:hypothetical protein